MNERLLPGLREELVAAARARPPAERGRRPARTLAALAAAAAVLVVAVVAVNLQGSPTAEAGVDIQERDGIVTVRLVDVETRPEVVQEALRDAGIDATVVAVPVGPSRVGSFIRTSATDQALQPDQLEQADGPMFEGFRVPAGHPDPIELALGRPATAGETYAVFSDAYLPGEPFSCLGIYGAEVRSLPGLVPEGVAVDVVFADGAETSSATDLGEAASSERASYRATNAQATSSSSVTVFATPDGSPAVGAGGGACRE